MTFSTNGPVPGLSGTTVKQKEPQKQSDAVFLTAGETDVNNIRCVIYLDRVYTGGWTVDTGKLTAQLPDC